MSITIKEVGISSASGTSPNRERSYTVLGASDIDAAEAALTDGTGVTKPVGWTGIPTTDAALPLDNLEVVMRDNSATTFDATASYDKGGGSASSPTPPATSDEEISFDISSQTARVTQSKSTTSSTAVGGQQATDRKGGIGWDGERYQGADVFVELFSFTITKYVPVASVTNAYVQGLRDAAFRYNSAAFRGMAAGECLFVGASGSKRNDDDYAIAHKFLGSKNATNIAVGDITVPAKLGWEYLWAEYEAEEDATAKKLTPRPTVAHVERLYDSIDFPTALGLTA